MESVFRSLSANENRIKIAGGAGAPTQRRRAARPPPCHPILGELNRTRVGETTQVAF